MPASTITEYLRGFDPFSTSHLQPCIHLPEFFHSEPFSKPVDPNSLAGQWHPHFFHKYMEKKFSENNKQKKRR